MSNNEDMLLTPGQQIRPIMNNKTAKKLAENLYGFRVTGIKELNSYDDRNYLVSTDKCENENVSSLWPHGYVLKVTNTLESKSPKLFEAQNAAMNHLNGKGFVCPTPIPNAEGKTYSIEKITYDLENSSENNVNKGGSHIVRMLTFIPGKMMTDVPYGISLFFKLGKYAGEVDNALMDFPLYDEIVNREIIWKMSNVPKISPFVKLAIKEPALVNLVTGVLSQFEKDVIGAMGTLPKGHIHGDLNENNIIVKRNSVTGDYDIYGLIDFGDVQVSCYVFELAVIITYAMLQCQVIDPSLVAGHVVAGWLSERPLTLPEWRIVKILVEGRLCQSLVMGAYSHLNDPSNNYLLSSAPTGWTCLQKLRANSSESLYPQWVKIIESYGPTKYSLSASN